jgi:hypothetical protein
LELIFASRRVRGWVVSCVGALALAAFSLPGWAQLAVGQDGQPGYQHPIAVPPGIAGMVPTIALAYGGDGNGPVGHGWSLTGVSSIARCGANLATDGRLRGVDNTAADKLCLDGQRLIQTDATGVPAAFPQTNDSAGGGGLLREFRTERDSFARIRAYGSGSGAPAYFKVWTKDGRVYEYGNNSNSTADAAVTAQGTGVITTWLVSRVSDLRGNYIDYQYQQRDGLAWGSGTVAGTPIMGHDWSLREIRYTGTPTQAPGNKVVFSYDDLPALAPAGKPHARREAYVAGSKLLNVQRLTQVQSFVNADGSPLKVNTLRLGYDSGAVTNRSRLRTITECAGAAESPCLPPVKFDYAPDASEAYQRSTTFSSGELATLTMQSTVAGLNMALFSNYGVITADFDGDGKTDLIRWSDNPAENRLYLSNGDGSFRRMTGFNLTGADNALFHSTGCFNTRVVDFNGDGLPDLLRYRDGYETNTINITTACPAYATELYLNKGDGTFERKPITGVTLAEKASRDSYLTSHGEIQDGFGWTFGSTFYLLDIDGDGLIDLVTAIVPNQGVQLNPSNDACATVVCTHVYKGDGQGGFAERPTNVTYKNLYSTPEGPYALGQPSHLFDLDNDGNLDLASAGMLGAGTNLVPPTRAWRSLGDFNFEPIPGAGEGCTRPIDFNGDGRADCVVTASGVNLYLSSGATGLLKAANYNLGNPYLSAPPRGIHGEMSADMQIVDVNRDGRDDILWWSNDPTQNKLYLSNGDGTFTPSGYFNLATASDLLQHSDSSAAFVTGDFTGRGDVEILRLRASATPGDATANQLYVKAGTSLPPDLLTSVTSPDGLKTTLTWVSLGSSASGALGNRYASDRGDAANAAVYPLFDAVQPGYVVATVDRDSGVGSGKVFEEFSYRGFKAAHDGRGPRGFREVRSQRPAADGGSLSQSTQIVLSHPYIGLPARTQSWRGTLDLASPVLLASEANIYCDASASTTAEAAATVAAPCLVPATVRLQRPYQFQSSKTARELNGDALPSTTVTTRYNENGDPKEVVAVTTGTAAGNVAQSITATTKHDYALNNIANDNWVLGGVQRSTQDRVVPNSLAAIGASAGTAPNAAATRGTAPAAALSVPAFAITQIGQTSSGTATLSNTGGVAINMKVPTAAAVSSASGSEFSFAGTTCGATLAANASCTVSVTFTPAATGARTGGLNINTELGLKSAVLSGTGQAPSGSLSAVDFGSVAVGSAPTLTSTLTNTGVGPLSVTVPTAASVSGADFGFVSTTCGGSLPVGGSCTVTVRFQPTANAVRNGGLSINTGAGALSAALSGTGLQSVIAVTGNGAASLTAQKGGAAGGGTVTFTNSGNQAATLTMSGLSAPYSVSPASCVAPAGGSCAVTVSMTAAGAIGAQGGQTLTATGGTTGAVSASVAGTLYGSAISVTGNGATSLSATKGGSAASGTVSFTNSGNQAVTLAMSGLSGAYSVAPGSCTVDPGGTCTVTVSMSTGNGIGAQGAQTLVATGGTLGVASATVSGTVTGSTATFISGSLAYGTVNQNSTAPVNLISFRNDGNVPMTLTGLSGLPAVLSIIAGNCSNVTPGQSCWMNVQLATGALTNFSQAVSTVGATVNASTTASGTVQTVPGALFNLSTAATSTTTYTTITLTVANPYSAAQAITAVTQSDAGTPGTSTCSVGGSVAASPGSCTFQWVYDRCTARTVNFSVKNAFGTATTSKAIVKGTCL